MIFISRLSHPLGVIPGKPQPVHESTRPQSVRLPDQPYYSLRGKSSTGHGGVRLGLRSRLAAAMSDWWRRWIIDDDPHDGWDWEHMTIENDPREGKRA